MLVVGLFLMIGLTVVAATPLIRRRQRLVNDREAAIARVSGHVADSLMNMETVRAFAARAAGGGRTPRQGRGLPAPDAEIVGQQPARRHPDRAHVVLTNVLGLLSRHRLRQPGPGVEEVVVAFTYYSSATQIMFEFNQIYRRLESSTTEPPFQFTELL
ncbi:hypothetical protein ACQ9NK_31145 [Streptomyces lividans]